MREDAPVTFPPPIPEKLSALPDKPGVYLMRDRTGRVIYVGKAISLRQRVRNYFQPSTLRDADPKIRGLIKSIRDFDILVLRNEAEALLTEGRLIKEYRPHYNSSFKDDKRFPLLALDVAAPFPRLELCRLAKDDGRVYFGPYASAAAARAALDFTEKHFGLRRCRPLRPGPADHKHCLADIVRHCAAPCVGKMDAAGYAARVEEARAFLAGERPETLREIGEQMRAAAAEQKFERAAALRDLLFLLKRAVRQRVNLRRDFQMRREDAQQGLQELQAALGLPAPPRVIETFDISNISGTFATASMVCCVDGLPARTRYRRYRIRTVEGSDDPAMMHEAVSRRYRRLVEEGATLPDLVVCDGGITQLRAGRAALDALGLTALRAVGLAKQQEEVYWDVENREPPLRLPRDGRALQVLTRIRDEAHRFALAYHRELRERRIRDSLLDEIPGIGDRRKEELLRVFGSVARLRRATPEEIAAKVPGLGESFARTVWEFLQRARPAGEARDENT
jgi:excinuclease ABC subunit C